MKKFWRNLDESEKLEQTQTSALISLLHPTTKKEWPGHFFDGIE